MAKKKVKVKIKHVNKNYVKKSNDLFLLIVLLIIALILSYFNFWYSLDKLIFNKVVGYFYVVNSVNLLSKIYIYLVSILIVWLMYFFRKEGILKFFIIALLVMFLLFLVNIVLFVKGYFLGFVVFAVITLISFFFFGVNRLYITYLEKERMHLLLQKYVSKNVVEQMLKSPRRFIGLNAERKYVSVLFADIRGFTKMSSTMAPQEVVNLLNTYLKDMTDEVFKHKGTLDKYVGDEIMAVFNSPNRVDNHEISALMTAIEMQKHVKKINEKTGLDLGYGIGINSGPVIVGSIGSDKRLDYTAIGDVVNVASRFCSVAKKGEIVIGETTYNMLPSKLRKEFKVVYYELKGKGKVKAYKYKVF